MMIGRNKEMGTSLKTKHNPERFGEMLEEHLSSDRTS